MGLAAVTQSDLEDLDASIARLRQVRDELARAMGHDDTISDARQVVRALVGIRGAVSDLTSACRNAGIGILRL